MSSFSQQRLYFKFDKYIIKRTAVIAIHNVYHDEVNNSFNVSIDTMNNKYTIKFKYNCDNKDSKYKEAKEFHSTVLIRLDLYIYDDK